MAVTGKSGKIYADAVKNKSVSELFRMGYTSAGVDDFKHVILSTRRKSSALVSVDDFEKFSKMGGLLLATLIIAALEAAFSSFNLCVFFIEAKESLNILTLMQLCIPSILSISLAIVGIVLICLRMRVGRILFIASFSLEILICLYNIAISGYMDIYDIPTILLSIVFVLYMALANRVKVYLRINKSKTLKYN